jgi:RNA polymerase-binding transcription factor DksA
VQVEDLRYVRDPPRAACHFSLATQALHRQRRSLPELISNSSVPDYLMTRRKQIRMRRKPKAATRDVVGGPSPVNHVVRKWRENYKRLLELRDRLSNRQADLTRDALEEQPSFSTHMADAATDTYDRDLALGMLSSEQDAAYELDEAINRIQAGTYGICELTGKPIEPARLEAIPWTRFSTEAEKQLEREGALKHARLGPRETLLRESPGQASDDEL